MHQIHINFTLPLVFSYLPLIILVYAVAGTTIWFTQNLWVAVKSDYAQDSLWKIENLYRLVGYLLVWPRYLVIQFRIKVLKTSLDKVMRTSGPTFPSVSPEVYNSIKNLKGGEKIRLTYNQSRVFGTDKVMKEGIVKRKFGPYNCSTLVFEGSTLREENGSVTSLVGAPVEVLV